MTTPKFYDHSPPQEIDEAIASYRQRTSHRHDEGETQSPYDTASLAEIYEPRVQQLEWLKAHGFTRARWGFDAEAGSNRWFGIETDDEDHGFFFDVKIEMQIWAMNPEHATIALLDAIADGDASYAHVHWKEGYEHKEEVILFEDAHKAASLTDLWP